MVVAISTKLIQFQRKCQGSFRVTEYQSRLNSYRSNFQISTSMAVLVQGHRVVIVGLSLI